MANQERDKLCHQLEAAHGEDEERVRQAMRGISLVGMELPNTEYIWSHGSLGLSGYRIWDMAAPLFSLDLVRAAYRDLSSHAHGPDTYRFVGTLLEPAGVTLPPGPRLTVGNSGIEGSYCGQAEPYFYASWIQALSERRRGHGKVSVYHTPDGEPILFRKSSDASTALTLQPMEMEGMPIAPGTIVSPAPAMSNTMTGEKAFGRGSNRYRLRTYELPPDVMLSLGRLSAWAFDDADKRQLFAVECYGDEFIADPKRAHFLAETTLADFRLAAQHVMELCGVAQQPAREESIIEWPVPHASSLPRILAV